MILIFLFKDFSTPHCLEAEYIRLMAAANFLFCCGFYTVSEVIVWTITRYGWFYSFQPWNYDLNNVLSLEIVITNWLNKESEHVMVLINVYK